MKFLFGLFMCVLVVSSSYALPARHDPKNDAEVVVVPLEKQVPRRPVQFDDSEEVPFFRGGVIGTDSGYPFFSYTPSWSLPSFDGWSSRFYDSFEDIFKSIRDQFTGAFDTIPRFGEDGDEDKGNTTSVVKIVGDHKVVVNETVYNKETPHGHSVYKVRIVSVLPLEDGDTDNTNNQTPEVTTQPPKDDNGSPEVIEKDAKDNEILGNIDSTESTELHTEDPSTTIPPTSSLNSITETTDIAPELETLKTISSNDYMETLPVTKMVEDITRNSENFDFESLDMEKDISEPMEASEEMEHGRDEFDSDEDPKQTFSSAYQQKRIPENIDSNELQMHENEPKYQNIESFDEAEFPDHIEGEFTDHIAIDSGLVDSEQEQLNEWEGIHDIDAHDSYGQKKISPEKDYGPENYNDDIHDSNCIDIYDALPIDLSNDIAVNQILADQGAAVNPDAEVFSVDEFYPRYQPINPKFETINSISQSPPSKFLLPPIK